jgi:hypothetical protein
VRAKRVALTVRRTLPIFLYEQKSTARSARMISNFLATDKTVGLCKSEAFARIRHEYMRFHQLI